MGLKINIINYNKLKIAKFIQMIYKIEKLSFLSFYTK